MKKIINNFASWLWFKTHEVTATEIMLMEELKQPRKCEHCGKSPIIFLDEVVSPKDGGKKV